MRGKTVRQILWFIGIWLLSILALGAVAYVIRLAINP
tara:strand:+ start:1210 stop:1320 length:111 start_codon:yes stop_codon:yes gene_type:complete